MIGMNLKTFKATMFADSKAILSVMDRRVNWVLKRFGAFVRRTARGSIRRRKRRSLPGQAPTNRTGLLKNHIYFVANPHTRNVIIGPAEMKGRFQGAEILEALESGGMSPVYAGKGKTKKVFVEARPFMGPAFEKEKPKLPQIWRESITK